MQRIKEALLRNHWRTFYRDNKLPEVCLDEFGIKYQVFAPIFLEEICLPPYRGDGKLDDYSALFSILDSQKPRVVLELGTGFGNTVANICSQLDCRVFTVNALPNQISGRVTTYSLTSDEIGSVYKTHGFSQRVAQVYEDTKTMNLKDLISEKSINFAIVDACHDSDYVLNDFKKVLPFMANGSIVMLHDTHPSMEKHYIGSYIACMYLRKLGFNIKYIKASSWAIWFENDGALRQSRIKHAISSIIRPLEKLIFGNNQNDLLRIRRYARKIIN